MKCSGHFGNPGGISPAIDKEVFDVHRHAYTHTDKILMQTLFSYEVSDLAKETSEYECLRTGLSKVDV